MAIGVVVDNHNYAIGEPALLKAWFSSMYVNLEGKKCGKAYPAIMREFYSGKLDEAGEDLFGVIERAFNEALKKPACKFVNLTLVSSSVNPHRAYR